MTMMRLPALKTNHPLINTAFRVALGDLVGNIQPFQDGLLLHPERCILAGLEYDTPWTRDTAINVWNGAGLICPREALHTLLSVLDQKVDAEGVPGPVTIGGQYWDAIIWTTGAWAYYLYTGDHDFLNMAFSATLNSLAHFERTEFNPATGLFRGPACYGDGVAAYPDRYAQTNGSSSILEWPRCNPGQIAPTGFGIPMQALSTNCLYYNAYRLLDAMADELGKPFDPDWQARAEALKTAINTHFWDPAAGQYRYLVDPWGGCGAQEGLGSSFALLFGLASEEQARQMLHNQVITPFGIPCVWPSFERYKLTPDSFGRHSGTVWPHVQGFWAEAAARAGNPELFSREFFTLAGLATRDGMFAEIYHPETGAVYGGVQEGAPGWQWHSCRRQTWSATAFFRMVLMGVLGMQFSPRGITFAPLLPAGLTHLELRDLPYRRQNLHITLSGNGSRIASFSINGQQAGNNGQATGQPFLSAAEEGDQQIEIQVQ